MPQSVQPGRFGHIVQPDEAWLAKQEKEPILEPELPIIDTHHHLWQRGDWTYLLPELLADLNTGHNIVATVFDCLGIDPELMVPDRAGRPHHAANGGSPVREILV